ncbi:PREDICTED: uncharacterized protein LOC109313433 [Crocodylus porosus]|uniref:uncharacterized protein LOC109313433 n=1 Tax=Crocodylus porosus TaxID=8502 RepID=UPI00093B258D|nr:PREDICTED: uncharacterized protein LOC109313433 [Crocodylus porosus]
MLWEKTSNYQNIFLGAPAPAPAPVMLETAKPVKRKLTKDITCLKDFMEDPKREEPLVGLEHVVEIRFAGRREPYYECKLCVFNAQLVPMIGHLSGYKHRRAYVDKEYRDKINKIMPTVKEDKVSFFRRIAREIEKTEGLKMFKTKDYTGPSTSSPSKKKARWENSYKPENDPVWKERALQFLETFRITSDSEATQVVSITQNLTEALRAFCEKKAAEMPTGAKAFHLKDLNRQSLHHTILQTLHWHLPVHTVTKQVVDHLLMDTELMILQACLRSVTLLPLKLEALLLESVNG